MSFMAAALPFFQIAGSVISAISALNQGSSSASASTYNAQIAEQNAAIARSNADAQARQQERETYLRLGTLRASAGHSGGETGAGSVLDVLGDVAAQSELEIQDTRYRGELAARGYQNTATLDRASASNAETGGYMKAGAELLQGGANYYSARERLKRTG